jgi:DNA-binding NtrC family response regulator
MTKIKPKILAVDDEQDMLDTFKSILNREFEITTTDSGEAVCEIIRKENVDLVLLDIKMPKVGGVDVLKNIKEIESDLDVIMVTASKEIKSAVECIKLGALDYITKPFEVTELKSIIKNALKKKELQRENSCLKRIIREADSYCDLIGGTEVMKKLFRLIDKVSKTDSTVLITGESGTGKELAAKAIHRKGARRDGLFVAVNCAAIPDNLLESELFGFESGSFTGAYEKKLGKFELASGGTIFLDEIGCMSPNMQAKILRVLEDKKIDRIGGKSSIPVNVRIISATNIDFESAISEGKFRKDLYYRLNVIPIRMPSLRERNEDIPMLAGHFLSRFNKELNRKVSGFSDEAMKALLSYSWPGNVRELQNLTERVVALSKNGMVSTSALSPNIPVHEENGKMHEKPNRTLTEALSAFERSHIEKTLGDTGGNNSQAARILGIHRTTLLSRMRNLKLK